MPKPSGYIEIVTLDGKVEYGETLTCCHCSKVWRVIKGSGRTRGFCLKCMKPTCGAKDCFTCVPFEKKLDLLVP